MAGKKKKPTARSYNYEAYIEGKKVAVSKISGIKSHWDIEPIQEGGRNNTEYKNKVHGKITGQLILSRATIFGEVAAYESGQKLEQDVEIFLTDTPNGLKRGYTFIGCTIMDVNYSDLDAKESNLVLEDICIEYQRMVID